MEEKVLAKGVLGGKLIIAILMIISLVITGICAIGFMNNHDEELAIIFMVIGICLIVFWAILGIAAKKREITVTDKRVIAKGAFGYRQDLPIEKITNVSTGFFNKIGCGSPSAKIRFYFCKNKMEVFDAIIAEVLQRDSKQQ